MKIYSRPTQFEADYRLEAYAGLVALSMLACSSLILMALRGYDDWLRDGAGGLRTTTTATGAEEVEEEEVNILKDKF
jgi:hypothetical protein